MMKRWNDLLISPRPFQMSCYDLFLCTIKEPAWLVRYSLNRLIFGRQDCSSTIHGFFIQCELQVS